ncbi:CinA family protein [Terrihabitans sp. B22-R8]|uniref:CinA family protein n=1 Tax=Terrihabitans sp. B22-R8 TaxID=3425128 RepID=UPI00403C287C
MSHELEFTRIDKALIEAAAALLDLCCRNRLTIVTAESCTGGLVAAALTDAPGASRCVVGGFVTYANEAKEEFIGVPKELIDEHGAVSEAVARAMAEGALRASSADLAVAITGIAGPKSDDSEKPVGLVHFAVARRNGAVLHRRKMFGDVGRGLVRRNSAMEAIDLLAKAARQKT